MVGLGEIVEGDTVLEIGPGRGILTEEIIKSGAEVIVVEIDRRFCSYLRDRYTNCTYFRLIEGDILKIDWKEIFPEKGKKVKVISNLPYYLTTPILFRLFEWRRDISIMILTMQLEVAKRLVARPSTRDYGILSVATQFFSCPSIAFKIKPGSFYPSPKVTSAVVKICMREDVKDAPHFFYMVRTIFGKRRKMLANTLKDLEDVEKDKILPTLKAANIDGTRRPETLSIQELRHLYGILYNSSLKKGDSQSPQEL